MAGVSARTACSYQHHTWVFHPNFMNFSSSLLSLPSRLLFLPSSSINHTSSSLIHLRRSFSGSRSIPTRTFPRCRAVTPGPPPGDEPPQKGITRFTTTFSRVWDTMQIFFAVFIWMSLFFWASASDRNNTGGRSKGNRWRK